MLPPGEFRLPIYILDLSRPDLTSEFLERAFRETEQRSIILFEDVDAAFLSKRQVSEAKKEAQKAMLAASAERKEKLSEAGVELTAVRIMLKGRERFKVEVAPEVDTLKSLRGLVRKQGGHPEDAELRLALGEELLDEDKDDELLSELGVGEGTELKLEIKKAHKERAALKSSKLSFSALLQILDGIKSPEGRVVVVRVDPSRVGPSRVE